MKNHGEARSITVNGDTIEFRVIPQDPLVKESALIATTGNGGEVLEEPARHEHVGEYPKEELERLWRVRRE